jgi:hypothetical protein
MIVDLEGGRERLEDFSKTTTLAIDAVDVAAMVTETMGNGHRSEEVVVVPARDVVVCGMTERETAIACEIGFLIVPEVN